VLSSYGEGIVPLGSIYTSL